MKSSTIAKVSLAALLLIAFNARSQNESLIKGDRIPLNTNADVNSIAVKQDLGKAFNVYNVYSIDAGAAYNNTATSSFNIRFQLGTEFDWNLYLEPSGLLSDDYTLRVATENGIVTYPKPADDTYKGFNNNFSDYVRLSIRSSEIIGVVMQNGEYYFIQPVSEFTKGAPADWFVVYNSRDVIETAEAVCSTEDPVGNNPSPVIGAQSAGVMVAEIAMACDYSFYVDRGGTVVAAQKRIVDVLNTLQVWYCNSGLDIVYNLVETFISTCSTCDAAGWGSSSLTEVATLLPNIKSWDNAGGFIKTHDITGWWTKRNLSYNSGTGTVGYASVSVVCTTSRQHILEHYTSTLVSVSIDQAHELGHNWSGSHTATPCGTYIMCPTIGSTNNTWDATNTTNIINHKNSRTCLTTYPKTCGVYTTGIDNNSSVIVKDLLAYPNPNASMLTVEAKFAKQAWVNFEITDVVGQRVVTAPSESALGGIYKKGIDISSLSPGIYLVHLYSGDQELVTRIVKE